jgi:hypothetical protein
MIAWTWDKRAERLERLLADAAGRQG